MGHKQDELFIFSPSKRGDPSVCYPLPEKISKGELKNKTRNRYVSEKVVRNFGNGVGEIGCSFYLLIYSFSKNLYLFHTNAERK